MPFLICALIVGLVFGRKQFTYLELAPGLYLIEGVMLLIVVALALRLSMSRAGHIPVGRSSGAALKPWLEGLSAVCLMLALFKGLGHLTMAGEASKLQELPILVYPFFLTLLMIWLSIQSAARIDLLHQALSWSVLCFPVFFIVLYTTGTLDLLTLLDKPLWPNNNFLFAACVLVAAFHRERYPLPLLLVSTVTALVGILIEAQRGTFVCLALAMVFLLRRVSQLAQFIGLLVAAAVIVSMFGQDLSYRFEEGVSDLGSFLTSVNTSNDDPRYSSTAHRSEMWSHVLNEVASSPVELTVGKPISESIVPEAWRNPHNGYISALGRGGVLAALFYLLLLIDAVRALLHSRRNKQHALTHVLYFTACVDATTQTVFDSPYSLFIVILCAALSLHERSRADTLPLRAPQPA